MPLSIVAYVMNTEINTLLVRRTWFEKLRMWRHAYETKIFDERQEVVVRGPTPDAARKAALKQWNEQIERWREED